MIIIKYFPTYQFHIVVLCKGGQVGTDLVPAVNLVYITVNQPFFSSISVSYPKGEF